MEVARKIHAKRTAGGALELEGVEVQVQLDNTKKIEDLIPKQVSNSLYETYKKLLIESLVHLNMYRRKNKIYFPKTGIVFYHFIMDIFIKSWLVMLICIRNFKFPAYL